nr:reverse transcriptase domain-containing protein [Tanacetum cinerariifolium]
MAKVPPNDPIVNASAIIPAPVNPDHAPAQPVSLGNGFAPHWIGENMHNNQNGWIEEDAKEKEEDPEEEEEDPEEEEEDSKEDDDDVMEMDNEAEVIDPYMDDGANNPPPSNSEDKETPPNFPVIPDADGQPIPPIASFGQTFHFGESSSTSNLLTGNSRIVLTGPMCPNLGMAWKRLGKMEKIMSKRIDTEGRVKKKFKEQDRHFVGLGCDNIEMDRTVRNVMSDLSGLKKLVKDLSDRVDEEPPAEPFARLVLAPYPNDPYVVTRDAAIDAADVATFGIDDDDTAPMDSQPYKPRGSPRDIQTMPPRKSTRGNPPPPVRCGHLPRSGPELVKLVGGHFGNKSYDQENVGRDEVILCPGMVTTKQKKVEAYIRRLSKNIKGEVTLSEPATLNKAVRMEQTLMEQKVKAIVEREADNKKRKCENFQGGSSSGGRNNNSNRNNNYPATVTTTTTVTTIKTSTETLTETTKTIRGRAMCGMQQNGNCPIKCSKCRKIGHKARYCWSKMVAAGANAQPIVTCYECGEKGNIKTNCPARNNPGRGGARRQAYALRDGNQNLRPNIVAEKGNIKTNCPARNNPGRGGARGQAYALRDDHSYEVELADRMEVHVPLKKRTLMVKSDDCVSRLKVVSYMKVKKYVDRGSYLFVIQVVEKEPAERCLENVPVICKFPDVFLEDLSGLSLPRQVEFEIELVLGAAPMARAPYRLAPSEMKELAK